MILDKQRGQGHFTSGQVPEGCSDIAHSRHWSCSLWGRAEWGSCIGLGWHKSDRQFTRRASMYLQVTCICVETDGHKRPVQRGWSHSRNFHYNLFLYIIIILKGSNWYTHWVTVIYASSSVNFYTEQGTGIINYNYSYVIAIIWNFLGRLKVKISLN